MKENKNTNKNIFFFIRAILQGLRFSSSRVSIIFISVALGACVTASFVNIYLDIDSKMSRELKAYGANFIITSTNFEKNPYIHNDDYERLESKMSGKDLIGFNPYLFGQARLSLGSSIIAGVNFSELRKVKPFIYLNDGSFINVEFDERNALVGVDLAKKMELKVGSDVDILNESTRFITKVKIKGIISTGDKEDSILFISLPLAQKILDKDNMINYIEAVVLGDYDQLVNLGESLSTQSISAKPLARISKSEGQILSKLKLLMALVALCVLIITSMCVNTTLSSIIFSRTKEIALLRALGASKRSVANLFGVETFVLTLSASLIGALLGFILAQLLGQAIFGSGIDFRFLSIPVAVGISLIFAAFAAYFPIKKSLNVNVANILRGE